MVDSTVTCLCWILLSCSILQTKASIPQKRITRQTEDALISQIRQFLEVTKQEDGTIDLTLLFRDFVHDPLPVPNFNITDSSTMTSVDGHFWNVRLSGLRAFEIKQVRVNLAHMFFKADVYFPLLRLDSEYQVEGSVTFFTISGIGNMWMNATNVELTGSVFLTQIPSTGHLQVESIGLEAETDDIKLHFDNLGGSSWSSVTNALLNQLSHLIFEHIKTSLLRDLKNNLRMELNRRFQKIPIGFVETRSANMFDDILLQTAESFKRNSLDPMIIPNHTRSFSKNMMFTTVKGSASISNGTLHGLSTLHRTGDIILIYNNTAIGVEATLGFSNLVGGCNWNVKFMGSKLNGYASVTIRSISANIVLHQDLRSGSKPVVSELKVNRIRQIWVDVQGLGTWDYIIRIVGNLIANSLKLTIADAISERVKESIQDQLDNLPIELL